MGYTVKSFTKVNKQHSNHHNIEDISFVAHFSLWYRIKFLRVLQYFGKQIKQQQPTNYQWKFTTLQH